MCAVRLALGGEAGREAGAAGCMGGAPRCAWDGGWAAARERDGGWWLVAGVKRACISGRLRQARAGRGGPRRGEERTWAPRAFRRSGV